MSVNLIIPETTLPTPRKFTLPQRLSHLLDLYVEAAKSSVSDAQNITDSAVVEAILEQHFRKDKAFREWLDKRSLSAKAHGLSRPLPSPRALTSATDGWEEK